MPLEYYSKEHAARKQPWERIYWLNDFIPWKGRAFFALVDTWLAVKENVIHHALAYRPNDLCKGSVIEQAVANLVDDIILNRLVVAIHKRKTLRLFHPDSVGTHLRWVADVDLTAFADDCVRTLYPRLVTACERILADAPMSLADELDNVYKFVRDAREKERTTSLELTHADMYTCTPAAAEALRMSHDELRVMRAFSPYYKRGIVMRDNVTAVVRAWVERNAKRNDHVLTIMSKIPQRDVPPLQTIKTPPFAPKKMPMEQLPKENCV
jgi:hypothetical protein